MFSSRVAVLGERLWFSLNSTKILYNKVMNVTCMSLDILLTFFFQECNLAHTFFKLRWNAIHIAGFILRSSYWLWSKLRLCTGSESYSPAFRHELPGLKPGQSVWDLWSTKWHNGEGFSHSISVFPLLIKFCPTRPFITDTLQSL
jgi:hypothetical protein